MTDDDFVAALLPPAAPSRQLVAIGTVLGVQPTLRVTLEGSTVPVRVQDGWTPQPGDRVPLLRIGSEWLALRKLADD